MKRAISMIMVLVLALSMCVVGASAVESDAISETSATVGNERASWGYVKIRYDPNGAWGEGSINTYAGTAYYMYVKVYATYSNGDADGPSDTASGYNKESVVTDNIYENGRQAVLGDYAGCHRECRLFQIGVSGEYEP